MTIKSIGVVGAGQMGLGIAQVAAFHGYATTVVEVSEAQTKRAQAAIEKSLSRLVEKGKATADQKTQTISNLTWAKELSQLKSADLVIEAVPENAAIKEKVYKELCPYLKPNAILASNTSSNSITRLASHTDRPERFMGMHFMNPVPIMKLVEVIRGLATTDETVTEVLAVVEKMQKVSAVSNDFPGFIINRILMPMINEAAYALYENIGTIEAIDTGMKLGTNQPMGPLELADFIGLDTCYEIMNVLHKELGDSKYRPCPLLVQYVDAGWHGCKSGKGFYDYNTTPPSPTR